MNPFSWLVAILGASISNNILPWNSILRPTKAFLLQRENEIRTLLDFIDSLANSAPKIVSNQEQGLVFCQSLARNIYDSSEFLKKESLVNAKSACDLADFFVFKTVNYSGTNKPPSVDELLSLTKLAQECYRELIHPHIEGREMTFERLLNRIIEDDVI